MLTRRHFLKIGTALPLAGLFPGLPSVRAKTVMGGQGLLTQSWFHEGFLYLADDLEEARAAGKHLALIFELEGCPACRLTHEVNFADPQIADFVREHFLMVQLDIRGAREVTRFDGQGVPEGEFAKEIGVYFTPTTVFLKMPSGAGQIEQSTLTVSDLEVARMQGYREPADFLARFQFVQSGAYRTKTFDQYMKS